MFWNHANKQLSAYHHGELKPEESRRIAEHLLQCRRCRDEYEQIKFGALLAQRIAPEHAPEALWGELETMLDEGARPSFRAAALSDKPPACRETSQFVIWKKIGLGFKRRQAGGLSDMEGGQSTWRRPIWRSFAFHWAGKLAVAVAVLLVGGFSIVWYQTKMSKTGPKPYWEVTRIEGQPRVGEKSIGDAGKLSLGEWLVTDEASRARIDVGRIGMVTVEPNSQVKLSEASGDESRLTMSRGKMSALIWAPPRQFYVDTPSAVAVDLGCAYTLEVSDDGQGVLKVIAGWVAFEWRGRESFVPAMAMCVTRPQFGPGTPYFNDSAKDFQNALAIFDVAESGSDARAAALQTALAKSRKRDALTLWHLLARADGDDRMRVYNRLAELIPPPPQVTPEAVMRGDRGALDLWWEKLELGSAEWWRIWKAPVPSQTK